MRIYYTLLLFYASFTIFAQKKAANDTVVKLANITYKNKGNLFNFLPKTPPLNQIAGAPKAYYSYYWEFGDGKYSKKKEPKHTYKTKGNYQVKLWITNHYDTGEPPATRPKKVHVNTISKIVDDQASMVDDFEIKINREPIPNQEMVLVMSYKNKKKYVSNGKLFLFYNEQKYKANNFELTDIRTYHNEKQVEEAEPIVYVNHKYKNEKLYVSLLNDEIEETFQIQDSTKTDLKKTIEDAKNYYKNWSIFNFEDMNGNEERNMFFTLKTTPEMLKDTSAIISIRGVYVPDENYKNHKVKELEMEIVTSHDPNNMSSNGTFLNYRLVRYKTLKYKIRFQNDGEGPAKTIRLETDIPEMLDKSTLKVVDMYPKCKICPKKKVAYSCLDTTFTKNQAIFTFKNIYLPGSNQKNVKERDSTKGFVKYAIKFSKDFHKKKTKSRTSIIFDKNEPIITNQAITRFLPGISIGAKAGYNYFLRLKNSKSYFVGATISPFKSYRWYWQVEFLNSLHTYHAATSVNEKITQSEKGFQELERITTVSTYKNIDWTVPVLVRYNINNYIGLGAGIQGIISVDEKLQENNLIEVFRKVKREREYLLINDKTQNNTIKNSFTNFRKGLLFEATMGFSRIGPSIGARYIVNSEKEANYWQFYAIWKF